MNADLNVESQGYAAWVSEGLLPFHGHWPQTYNW